MDGCSGHCPRTCRRETGVPRATSAFRPGVKAGRRGLARAQHLPRASLAQLLKGGRGRLHQGRANHPRPPCVLMGAGGGLRRQRRPRPAPPRPSLACPASHCNRRGAVARSVRTLSWKGPEPQSRPRPGFTNGSEVQRGPHSLQSRFLLCTAPRCTQGGWLNKQRTVAPGADPNREDDGPFDDPPVGGAVVHVPAPEEPKGQG